MPAFCAAFAFFIAVSAQVGVAHADTSAVAAKVVTTIAEATPVVPVADAASMDACTPSADDLQQISAIQNDSTLSASQELRNELTARKKLLSTIIVCAQNEATSLETTLSGVAMTGGVSGLQSQLVSKLNEAVDFYNIELSKVSDAGVAGTEAVARETLAYRTGSYEPLAGEVGNFILWSQNQNLFATAKARMDETSRAVTFLLSATPNSGLQSSFAAAQASWQQATTENQAAENALMQSLPANQSLLLIQQSLTSLAATYQQFFAVSNSIKTLLPQ